MGARFPTAILVAAAALTPTPVPLLAQDGYDIALSGDRVMDPQTGFDAVRNVGVRGGETTTASEDPLSGEIVQDVAGLVVAPGFINLHAHGQTNRASRISRISRRAFSTARRSLAKALRVSASGVFMS